MSNITKTVNKTTVNGSDVFIYTFNVSFSGLSGPATNGKLTDFFPNKIRYTLPQTGSGIQSITTTSQTGGTLVTFNFGPVNNGTSLSFTVSSSFGPGRVNNDTFTNTATLFADDVQVATATAPTVNLVLTDNFKLSKFLLNQSVFHPGDIIEYTLSLDNTDLNSLGYQINNIVITDVLPASLIPDTTFTPVGNNMPFLGYSDPTYNGKTGSFTGNTLNFTLPSFSGGIYQIKFRAKISDSATPGQLITNTANWTVNGTARTPANNNFTIFEPLAKMGLKKEAPLYATIGGNIQYNAYSYNIGNVPLTNWILEDILPSQVDITKVSFNSVVGVFPVYTISIATSNAPSVYVPVLTDGSGNSGIIDLSPFIPTGNRVVSVKVTAPNMTTLNTGHFLTLFGNINNTATNGQVIINSANSSADSTLGNIEYTTSANTTLNGKSVLSLTKAISPNKSNFVPLEEFQFVLLTEATTAPIVNPVFTDLLPLGLDASTAGYYFTFYSKLGSIAYDSRNPGFPIPTPVYEEIKNYNGTGRTLVRWSFENFTLEFLNRLTLNFGVIVKLNSPNSFSNVGYLGNPGDNTSVTSTAFLDAPDYDDDGITTENIAQSNIVTGTILSSSEFSLEKWVKGSQDLALTKSGSGIAGSEAEYDLYVTNNQTFDLKNIEIIDILPYVGDTGVMLNTTPRGSQYNVYASSLVTAKIINVLGDPVDPNPAIVIEYSTSTNPIRFDQNGNPIGTGTWSTTPPPVITDLKSIKVTTDPSVILKPYERLIVTLHGVIPLGTTVGLTAYNSFAVRADKIVGGVTEKLLPTEPNKVGLTVVSNTTASIGNFVWNDLNGNGIYDVGEPGVNGVTVELYDETGTTLLKSTVTANNNLNQPGYYLFTNLAAGNYKVKFVPLNGTTLTIQNLSNAGSKPDPTTGFTNVITLAVNEVITNIIAGILEPNKGSIGNFVWNDLNGNGIYDVGEPGVNGVTVELYDETGTTLLDTTVTANNSSSQPGYYIFDNLMAGNYKVKFIPLAGTTLTVQNLTVNGSKSDPTTGFTNVITLGVNEVITDIIAGIIDINKGSIGNFVWNDLNGNGIYDVGEPGVNGVTVELYDATGTTLLDTTVTANNGSSQPGYYIFDNLVAGNYKVKFIPLAGTTLTVQNLTVNGSKPDPTTGFTNVITLGVNEVITDIIAGILEPCAPPVINTTVYCVPLNSVYNPLTGVTATDCQGNNITADVIVTQNTVNTAIAGSYTVSYEVTDVRGQTTTKTITVKVCDNGIIYQSITDLIESVALEQTAISHILNAEGEKIQKVLEISNNAEEILKTNNSVECTVKSITKLEMTLQQKLKIFENVINSNGCCGQ